MGTHSCQLRPQAFTDQQEVSFATRVRKVIFQVCHSAPEALAQLMTISALGSPTGAITCLGWRAETATRKGHG